MAKSSRHNRPQPVPDSRDVAHDRKARATGKAAAVSVVAAPAPPKAISVDIAPSPDAGEAVSLHQQANMLEVVDKASHVEALEFLRGAKQLKRKIEDHWTRITRSVDDLKRNLLDLKRGDLAPVEAAIAVLDTRVVTFVNAEQRRIRDEEDRQRRENEERARQKLADDLARQEQEALDLEAQSPALSAREQAFADAFFALGPQGVPSFEQAGAIARRVGYKNPIDTATKLLATPKILDYLASKRAAAALREQAAATKRAPLVVDAPVVESNLGKVAGTRMVTSYSCEVVDLEELIGAIRRGGDPKTVKPDNVYLNRQAEMLKEAFEGAYPGCRLVKRQTVAG